MIFMVSQRNDLLRFSQMFLNSAAVVGPKLTCFLACAWCTYFLIYPRKLIVPGSATSRNRRWAIDVWLLPLSWSLVNKPDLRFGFGFGCLALSWSLVNKPGLMFGFGSVSEMFLRRGHREVAQTCVTWLLYSLPSSLSLLGSFGPFFCHSMSQT